ncbi:MAG TPA: hypothetical protein VF111_02465 [Thermoanaerobaculia bacterium]
MDLTGSWTAGIAAGIFFAFVPWRFTHLTHLQHEWTLWMPLALLALLRLHERTSIANAALLAGALLMNGLTNLHWFAFGSVAIGVAALVLGRSVRFFTVSGCAALVALLPMIPVLLPYRHAQALYGMRGDAGETLAYSARAGDWLLPSLHNRIYGPFNDGSVDPERWLFPGVLAVVLALLALRARDRFVAIGFALAGNGAKTLIVHYDRLGNREPIVRAWLAREQLQPVYAGPFVEAFALDPAIAPAAVPRVQASELTGQLLHPRHWQLVSGPLEVEGWARGPRSVVRVDLLFDNRQERIPATLRGDRFTAIIPQRPSSIRADTDLQVEITDAAGHVRRLPQVWLRWKRAGDRLRVNPLPQTADLGAYRTR